jgi:hypothetical protein
MQREPSGCELFLQQYQMLSHPESLRHDEHLPAALHFLQPLSYVDQPSQHRPPRHALTLVEFQIVPGSIAAEQSWNIYEMSSRNHHGWVSPGSYWLQRVPGADIQVPLISTDPTSHVVHRPWPGKQVEHCAVVVELQHTPPRHNALEQAMSALHEVPSS